MPGTTSHPTLAARAITKRFPGVTALQDVSLDVSAGSVHAIVGENGAGKSTLMNILAGVYRADAGEIHLDGQPVDFPSPRAAERAGVVLIHQELNLVPALSVAENIFLGREPARAGFVARRRMEQAAARLLDRLGHHLDPRRIVDTLRVSDQQMVEIAKALSLEARVLVMDEPTTALARGDVERLFAIIRMLVKAGTAVIYISHKMDELFDIADEFTVLRDGRRTGHTRAVDTTPADQVRLMVGRDVVYTGSEQPSPSQHEIGEREIERLRVERLSSRTRDLSHGRSLSSISLGVRAGEILGVAGLMGAGRTELLESLFGLHPTSDESRIFVDGQRLAIGGPREAIRAGLAFVSEDRKAQGLVLDFPVAHNITLAQLKRFSRFGFLQRQGERAAAADLVQRLGIKTFDTATTTLHLSGGNQQKVVLAKWLLTLPKVLLLDEPTKGIDIAGKTDIYRLIDTLAANGLAIVLVSSELPELLALSDRILVLREGRVAGTLGRADATEERIIELATLTRDDTAAVA
jgi:ribose transport system ATP-binding protein